MEWRGWWRRDRIKSSIYRYIRSMFRFIIWWRSDDRFVGRFWYSIVEMLLLVVERRHGIYRNIIHMAWRISKEIENCDTVAAMGPRERILNQVQVLDLRNASEAGKLRWIVQSIVTQVETLQ
jgi:hypothetical protein